MGRIVPKSSWMTLTVIGAASILMGVIFVALRPLVVLLPEDQRYTSVTVEQLRAHSPALFAWIGMVFRSWGAFAIGMGILVIGISVSAYRHGERWAWWSLAVAGLTTFGIFLSVNLALGSDFRWVIAALCGAYIWALWKGRRS